MTKNKNKNKPKPWKTNRTKKLEGQVHVDGHLL